MLKYYATQPLRIAEGSRTIELNVGDEMPSHLPRHMIDMLLKTGSVSSSKPKTKKDVK